MKTLKLIASACLGALLLTPLGPVFAQAPPVASAKVQSVVDRAVQAALTQFAGQQLQSNQLAVTLVDLRDPAQPVQASYRGQEAIYPASVVKLFYLAAAHRWMEDGRIPDTAELRRAMRDMIVESYNEATHYVLDVLTDTTSGPELSPEQLADWHDKRNAVNRYFTAVGYTNINCNKKPWCEGPYGRETQAIKAFNPSRNLLTADATARLLTEIALGRCVTPKRSAAMMELLKRHPHGETKDPDDQAKFSGPALPPGAKLWSKAGWTSNTRHDAAYVELPGGEKFVLVVFTVNHANEPGVLHAIARSVVEGLTAK